MPKRTFKKSIGEFDVVQRRQMPQEDPVAYCLNVICGKWKTAILILIENKVNRFGAIRKVYPQITKQVLSRQLRELERSGIVERRELETAPVQVEYVLTSSGEALCEILHKMKHWTQNNKA